MKKSFVLILSCLLASTVIAQIGKVGINTTTPAAMLHVKDSSVLFSGTTTAPNQPGAPQLVVPGSG